MNSLKTKINSDLINITHSYLTISKEQIIRKQKLINEHISMMTFFLNIVEGVPRQKLYLKNISDIYKDLICDYCVYCDKIVCTSLKYIETMKIIINDKQICNQCSHTYFLKNILLKELLKN